MVLELIISYLVSLKLVMLEPSIIKEYSSSRAFHMRDVSWSGSGLTLHSFGSSHVIGGGDAVDLIFLSTDYVELPFEIFGGLRVTQPCDDLAIEYEQRFAGYRKSEHLEGKRVFVIESAGRRFHIVAGKLWILTRTHNLQSSINALLSNNETERTNFIEQHIKEWYKMTAFDD
ncbi:MAG: hypothetical protein K1X72_21365 [Pyrinomonadaceae bacterium]|nr:hypothetical protein [Pyrinomonadaceae bacterium]